MVTKCRKKRPSRITTAMAISRIDKITPLVIDNVQIAIGLESTFESANEIVGDIQLKNPIGIKSYGAHCYNVVTNSLLLNLALALARVYDRGTQKIRPNFRDIASIPLLVRLIKQKSCRAVLSKRARNWTPGIPSMADIHENTVRKQVDLAVSEYKSLMVSYAGRSALKTLKIFM